MEDGLPGGETKNLSGPREAAKMVPTDLPDPLDVRFLIPICTDV
jgi:hypothetical protein